MYMLYPKRRVAIIIEPVVAIITNQVDSVALGRAAGNNKS